MNEDVSKAAESAKIGAKRRAHDTFAGERVERLLVGFRTPPEPPGEHVIGGVEHDLATDLEPALDEPRQILVGRKSTRGSLTIPSQPPRHLLETSQASFQRSRAKGHSGSP